MLIHKGKLIQFRGTWGSGMGFLQIADSETGVVESVPCDNGPTVRALEGCFSNVITEGHTASGDGYKGREVFWSYDECGLTLGGFTPVEEASVELLEAYEAERKEVGV